MTDDDLIGSATACSILGIDRSTLIRRIQRGEIIPLQRLDGRSFVFSRASIEAIAKGTK